MHMQRQKCSSVAFWQRGRLSFNSSAPLPAVISAALLYIQKSSQGASFTMTTRIAGLIETVGLEKVGKPHVDHIEGPLWEIRMKGADGIARALYVTARGQRVVVVRVFVKKSQKTQRREIELSLKRAKEVT